MGASHFRGSLPTLAGTLLLAVAVVPCAQGAACEPGKLTASDGSPVDSFGWAVAVSGNAVIVGVPFDDDNLGATRRTPPAGLPQTAPPAMTSSPVCFAESG